MKLTTSKQGIFKIRFRISKKLQPYFNRAEINKSLKTKSIFKAKQRASIIRYRYAQILGVCAMLSKEQIQELVNKFVVEVLEEDLMDRANGAIAACRYDPDTPSLSTPMLAHADVCDMLKADYCEALSMGDYRSMAGVTDELLTGGGLAIDKNDDSYKLLSYFMMLAQIKVLTEIANRDRGEAPKAPASVIGELFDGEVKGVSRSEAKAEPIKKIKTNAQAVSEYLRGYEIKRAKHLIGDAQLNDVSNFFNDVFLKVVPPEEDVAETEASDIFDIDALLRRLPKRNIQKYRQMEISELLRLDVADDELIGRTTHLKQMKWIKSFYTYCRDLNYIQINIGGLIDTSGSATDPRDERLPITPEELRELLELTKDDEVLRNALKAYYTSGLRTGDMCHKPV